MAEGWSEGVAQGEKLGGIIFIFLRIIWFFVRIAWWMTIFVVLSVGAGFVGLVRLCGSKADDTAGFGRFSDDGQLWLDEGAGQQYPCSTSESQCCEVEADQCGPHWRRTAVSRLFRRGAIVRYKFYASSVAAAGAEPPVIAEEEFLQEARHNITLDHLDPAMATEDHYGLRSNRDQATDALNVLELVLNRRGWKRVEDETAHGQHWYSRIYERPVIRWDQPLLAVSAD
jgi:hypothetical protein